MSGERNRVEFSTKYLSNQLLPEVALRTLCVARRMDTCHATTINLLLSTLSLAKMQRNRYSYYYAELFVSIESSLVVVGGDLMGGGCGGIDLLRASRSTLLA